MRKCACRLLALSVLAMCPARAAGAAGRVESPPPAPPRFTVGRPAEAPSWAREELRAIQAMNAYFTAFIEAFVDEKTGKTVARYHHGTMDDVAEGFAVWDKFLLLAGSQRLRDAYVKIWQYLYDEAHRRGDFEKGFYRRGYDAEHSSELFQLLWGALEMDPANEKLITANRQVADCVIDRCYNPETRLIRTAWLTSAGAKKYRDYQEWDYILNTVFIHAAWQAYLSTGREKYRKWALEYGNSWNELALANGGMFPYRVDSTTRKIKEPWYSGPGFPYDRWGFTTAARMYHAWPVELVFLDGGNPKHLAGLEAAIEAMFRHGRDGLPASGVSAEGWSRRKYSWHLVKVVDRPYVLTFTPRAAQRLKGYISAIRKHDPASAEARFLDWSDFTYFGGGDLDLPAARFRSLARNADRRRKAILAGKYHPRTGDDLAEIGCPRLGWEFVDGAWWGLWDNGRCGGASPASIRYFHRGEKGKVFCGLPAGVAALVRRVAKDHVRLFLYNSNSSRTDLILTIFARRARTREARLQIELARLRYQLPRLAGAWTHLSRQRGGAKGNRGKGETQLETDRRLVLSKIANFKRDLAKVREQRDVRRKKRLERPVPSVSLVGYTNAGKSSLLNAVSGSRVLVEDKLFATLDPTTRRVEQTGGREFLITDTVGFIRKLPHDLVDAFRSTLEEAVLADVIIHVADAHSHELDEHVKVTEKVLRELGSGDKTRLLVLNKCDSLTKDEREALSFLHPQGLLVSAHTGEGIQTLLEKLGACLDASRPIVTLHLPPDRWDVRARLHKEATVLDEQYDDEGLTLTVRLSAEERGRLLEFVVEV